MLGLMQVAIMQAIDDSPGYAYGASLASDVGHKVGRDLSDAQIYVALSRLEERKLLTSRVEDRATRGRPRKYYALTRAGRDALKSAGAYF